ncbi:hypothetical protein BKA82DRAFT_1007365 [Pisolithus tinctorius]|uniref:Uncharacterized protein n=1 Tax=Pisolithus tinctorius Marx 270 TaxID=870435 RepID=A0A0C3IEW1_PISTI|nr:hypothetical protein BKA82DRAFT_1007365 [Pisolithus tinctorius]KIN95582.1 hypothetical protein M404DRAFT_1007365 [Pisolithus tinctorius Marx 270]KIO00106.1 hypothetical protein M404DRAFT_1004211 [Pisolithus tinctorius Marx 270]
MDSVEYIDCDDNQTHLQRIMRDARAGTSKHRLLLAARAAEQAKWSQSGTARATPIIDDLSASAQAPSTSAP